MTAAHNAPEALTLEAIAQALRPGAQLDDWLSWPPDVFAMTWSLLRRTGAYRLSVYPPVDPSWPLANPTWVNDIEVDVTAWRTSLEDPTQPSPLLGYSQVLKRWWTAALPSSDSTTMDSSACEFWATVLTLHAIADTASAGFGLISLSLNGTSGVMHFAAGQLLTLCGSLSRIHPSRGRVLPKMRTPQAGMSCRNLSHHMTFHETEIDMIWRLLPWIGSDSQLINILVVPEPFAMAATDFRSSAHTPSLAAPPEQRYFQYEPESQLNVDRVIEAFANSKKHARHIGIIVLPEAAATDQDLETLQQRLLDSASDPPIIICGIRSATQEHALGDNRVVMAAYFSAKWYHFRQDKHHRWKLDQRQIQTYGLSAVLPGSGNWWEAIRLPPRRMTILAANGWLALSPLVCEDLAQPEPLGDVIRGIGPTLILAILMDGPQLEHRWAARYATVLADDPGSAVLTVTSRGMAARSHASSSSDDENLTIAMWKDQGGGLRSFRANVNDIGLVLTVRAHWTTEYTADGRSDNCAAAQLRLECMHRVQQSPMRQQSMEAQSGRTAALSQNQSVQPQAFAELANDDDNAEMTLATAFASALLNETTSEFADVYERMALGSFGRKWGWPSQLQGTRLCQVVESFFTDSVDHRLAELKTKQKQDYTNAVAKLKDIIIADLPRARAQDAQASRLPRLRSAFQRGQALLSETISMSNASEATWPAVRLQLAVWRILLWTLHAKLSFPYAKEENETARKERETLRREIGEALRRNHEKDLLSRLKPS